MSSFDEYDFDETGRHATGWKKYRTIILCGIGLAGTASAAVVMAPEKSSAPPRKPMEAIVAITAPPPPPPVVQPPPPPPEPQQEEMVKQDEVVEETPNETPQDDTPEVGTNNTSAGPDLFGAKKGAGSGFGAKRMVGGRKGGKYDRYALTLQNAISTALRQHPAVNKKILSVQVRIWADQAGRVTRASLVKGTGDAQLDGTIQQSVLVGMQLPEPPPADMPMPVIMQITAQRPR